MSEFYYTNNGVASVLNWKILQVPITSNLCAVETLVEQFRTCLRMNLTYAMVEKSQVETCVGYN